jgi:hypothetical protein
MTAASLLTQAARKLPKDQRQSRWAELREALHGILRDYQHNYQIADDDRFLVLGQTLLAALLSMTGEAGEGSQRLADRNLLPATLSACNGSPRSVDSDAVIAEISGAFAGESARPLPLAA